nr:MGMT family protein [Celeribacter baekdonensis]
MFAIIHHEIRNASRAVGAANGNNPLPIILPRHRRKRLPNGFWQRVAGEGISSQA